MSLVSKTGAPASSPADLELLHSMGYAQELSRRLGGFSNFAISFSIICILSGGINSLAQATSGAGGAAIGLGWPIGVAISGVFGVAMAQIASSYPTAGGLYHWGVILGNRFTGWLTAWFNLVGLVTVLAAINVGTYYFGLGAFGGRLGIADSMTTLVTFLVILTGSQALINHYGIGLTTRLTDFSGYLILTTSVALAIVSLTYAEAYDLSRLWTFANYSGEAGGKVWPAVSGRWVFLLGLLLPIYTITGYDASAHTSEETRNAAMSVPRGIVSSILWSGLLGYFVLGSLILMLPDLGDAAKQGWNVFFWAMDQRVPAPVRDLLYLGIFTAQVLCGLATVTSASRMIFAFARDGGLPFSTALARVSPRHRAPTAAIWCAAASAVLFVWAAKWFEAGGTPVYTVVVSCSVIFLFFSCTIPITLGALAYGGPKWPKMGPWHIGRAGFLLFAVLSVLSMLLIAFVGVQPPNGLALTVTIGFVAVTAVVWLCFEGRRFRGPPVGDTIAKRQTAIAAAEAGLRAQE
jgi:amino acid transporter